MGTGMGDRPWVLAVDDERENLDLVERALRGVCNVTCFDRPREALDAMDVGHYDLILADQKMPDVTGVTLLERARSSQPRARRVILSAFADVPDLLLAINLGQIHRYIQKPVRPEQLVACVEALTAGTTREQGVCALVVDDPAQARDLCEPLAAVLGMAVRPCTELAPAANLRLALFLDRCSPRDLEPIARGLGGADRELALFVTVPSGAVEDAAVYLRAGADDVIWSPVSPEEVALRFGTWRARRDAEIEARRLRAELLREQRFCDIIGQSASMRAVFDLVERVGPSDSTVLIDGETGSGKELVARALHAVSMRRENAFVAVNLSALPESLVEAELFGHEAGAFTGASGVRIGRLEAADGGTLFLDEIGDLPMALQVKLLRVLEDRSYERLGSSRTRSATFRLVGATHRDLDQMVAEGTFREDLYYRLNVVQITLPPLRERREDIDPLAEYFLRRFCDRAGLREVTLSEAALAELREHAWPGNVRELQHVIERAVALSRDGETIGTGLVQPRAARRTFRLMVNDPLTQERGLDELVNDVEKMVLTEAMQRFAGNQTAVAHKLKLPRGTLRSRLKKHGL
ncbi:MAG: sigma-54-dependent Fis family transcriptional regulator [Deltaproteobacteria bacterium]|nr:sigma-54-dependent Fis family transcriptional regulator [Deltaproteobacteria bacterium]